MVLNGWEKDHSQKMCECPLSLAIREIQAKTIIKYQSTFTRVAKSIGWQYQVLTKMWSNWNSCTSLVGYKMGQHTPISVQFSRSIVSDSLRPHGSQHARPPCPSPTPGVHSDSRPSSPWCHPAISSSVIPSSSCPQSLPASEYFPMSQLFAWGGQSTGVSASASVLPKKSQGWSPSEWTGWISLQSKGLSRVVSNTTV